MDITFLTDYLNLIVLGICLCVGYILKNSVTKLDNKYIPLIMGVLGIVLSVWVNWDLTPPTLLQGLFSGLASTGLHQLFTQLINKE